MIVVSWFKSACTVFDKLDISSKGITHSISHSQSAIVIVVDNKVAKSVTTHPIVNTSSVFGHRSGTTVGAKAVVFINKQIVATYNTIVVSQRGLADGNVVLDSPLGSAFQLRVF